MCNEMSHRVCVVTDSATTTTSFRSIAVELTDLTFFFVVLVSSTVVIRMSNNFSKFQ